VVRGNTDDWLLYPALEEHGDPNAQRIQEIDQWCAEQLTAEDRAFLASF
jgi:hypothetical protein